VFKKRAMKGRMLLDHGGNLGSIVSLAWVKLKWRLLLCRYAALESSQNPVLGFSDFPSASTLRTVEKSRLVPPFFPPHNGIFLNISI